MNYRAIDVMGFAGGFTLGTVQAGFELAGKREMSAGFGIANCEANRALLGPNWKAQASEPEEWEVIPADYVFGNPPCSGFSVMSAKTFRGADSPINTCMWAFVRYVAAVNPPIAVFESVQIARTREDGIELMRALHAYLEELTGATWDLFHVRHNALSVGGGAMRRRYFWVVSRVPFGIEVPRLRNVPKLIDVIGDLSTQGDTWLPQPYVQPASWWAESSRSASGVYDGHMTQRTPLEFRIIDLMKRVEWNPGESVSTVARRYYERFGCLPDSWSNTAKKVVANNFNMGFTTPIRWDGDNYGRVVTGGSLCTAIHPTANRMLTHREVARIVGFPDDWRIFPLWQNASLGMTWGKGITVQCGKWISSWVKEALDGNPGQFRGERIGEREYDIDVTHAYQRLVR